MDQKYFVYIVECVDGSFYVGCTNNLEQRLSRHNSGKAADWTKKRQPVKLVYHEEYATLLSARNRERQLKGWTRRKKEKLIVGIWKKITN